MIIGLLAALVAALTGCSALRAGYSQGPQLVHWWLDGYVDLDDDQSASARDAIRAWFRWHRATQLPDLADLLAHFQGELADTVTPQQVCRLMDDVRSRMSAAFDHAVPPAVGIARTLTPAQLAHLERRHAKANAEYRRQYLQESTEERFKAALKRIVDRAESLYGRLDGAQRERIAQWVTQSPFDPEGWLVERQRRQREIVETLRRISTEALPDAEAQPALRRVYDNAWRSPREPYRDYQRRLAQYNCAFAAQLHNQATPEQRRHVLGRLKGWEDDLRTLANGG